MRGRRAVLLAACALVLIGGGAGGGFLLHSPDERVTVEVSRTTLTAPVQKRALTTTYTGSGTFSGGGEVNVQVSAPAGMGTVITDVPTQVGQPLRWCTVVVEVSGRPIILLRGGLPAYRDLTIGDEGRDVRQLQEALRDCGMAVRIDGKCGAGTGYAVEKLYRSVGYRSVTSASIALTAAAASPSSAPETDEARTASSSSAATAVVTELQTVFVMHRDGDAADEGRSAGEPTTEGSPTAKSTVEDDSKAGPGVVVAPRGELIFVPTTARAIFIPAPGSAVDTQPAARLALAGDRFVVAFSAVQRAAIPQGAVITIRRDDWTEELQLPALPDRATQDESGQPTYVVTLKLSGSIPAAFYGEEGQFSVAVGGAKSHELVVPIAAVFGDTDSAMYVKVSVPDSTASPAVSRVRVAVVAAAGGYAALKVLDGHLAVGDEVIIGDR